MRYLKYYKQLNEAIDVYHGTSANFDVFDMNQIGSGDGKSKGGWGLYFSTDKKVSERYFLKGGFIKKFRIREGEYFDLDESLDDGLAQQIIQKLQQKEISETEIESFQTDFIDYIPDNTNQQVYEWLSYVLGSEKNASLFLDDMGYIGNTFKDKWDSNATNYVLFSPDYVIKEITDDEDELY